MKKYLLFTIILAVTFSEIYSQKTDDVANLKSLLNNLSAKSDNSFFKIHCNSILSVIDSKMPLTKYDTSLLNGMYQIFSNASLSSNGSKISSYTDRKRPFIISWKSPTDNTVSLAWLILPENWDPQETYPLYVRLHGLASIYSNPIEYMIYYFKSGAEVSASFNDGYILLPWARGNNWYKGIGETDVLECMDVTEKMLKTDPYRKYLVGFSMGGFGTWYLGEKYEYMWAGLGIIAGALDYDINVFNAETAYRLQNIPVYITCGNSDGLLSSNEEAYEYIQRTGNPSVVYRTFTGSHESPLSEWQLMYEWLRNFSNDDYTEININKEVDNNTTSFPNPFSYYTTINYEVSKPGQTEITIYNISGQKVWERKNYNELPGKKSLIWNSTDNSGQILPAGIYFCSIYSFGNANRSSIILLKQ